MTVVVHKYTHIFLTFQGFMLTKEKERKVKQDSNTVSQRNMHLILLLLII